MRTHPGTRLHLTSKVDRIHVLLPTGEGCCTVPLWACDGGQRSTLFTIIQEENEAMWNITGHKCSIEKFRPFEPEEILYAFDGPRIFTFRDQEHELFLAYWSDEDENFNRFVVVPTSSAVVKALKTGETSVREALDQPRCWLCDVTRAGDLETCQRVEFSQIPGECLPAIGTMLLPDLAPPEE